MTTNVSHRTRVQPGVRTGGQFAGEVHAEAGVTLAPGTAPLDIMAVTALAERVSTTADYEVAQWQRRQSYASSAGVEVPLSLDMVELQRQAALFESLPKQEQGEVLDKLKFGGAQHLLEPGQKLGNDRVQVADGVTLDEGNIVLALTAQKLITDADLPGGITLTEVGDTAKFTVKDGPIEHSVHIGSTMLSFSAEEADDDYDYTRGTWLYRSGYGVYGGSVLEADRTRDLRSHFASHREFAVLMDAMAGSSFREHNEYFGELDQAGRTAVLKTDDTENLLDLSGDVPVLKTDDGKALHPSMVNGFLDHMATKTGHANRDSFVADLRGVFQETDRRLAN